MARTYLITRTALYEKKANLMHRKRNSIVIISAIICIAGFAIKNIFGTCLLTACVCGVIFPFAYIKICKITAANFRKLLV